MDPMSLMLFGLLAVMLVFMFMNTRKRQKQMKEQQEEKAAKTVPGAKVLRIDEPDADPDLDEAASGSNVIHVDFAPRDTIACERAYVVDAGGPDWQPPRPLIAPDYRGQTGELPVAVAVSVQNKADAGLGQPLPAGRVRVFDGGDFLGESMLPHTAANGEIRLQVGTAFDLGAKRESTAFRLDRAGRTITETFAVTLRNAKKTAATVRVIEPLPRWSDWTIVASSVPAEKKDARHAQFDVPVAAGGDTTLTYTVRYRWTQDVNP